MKWRIRPRSLPAIEGISGSLCKTPGAHTLLKSACFRLSRLLLFPHVDFLLHRRATDHVGPAHWFGLEIIFASFILFICLFLFSTNSVKPVVMDPCHDAWQKDDYDSTFGCLTWTLYVILMSLLIVVSPGKQLSNMFTHFHFQHSDFNSTTLQFKVFQKQTNIFLILFTPSSLFLKPTIYYFPSLVSISSQNTIRFLIHIL